MTTWSYSIVIVSNQAIKPLALKSWKQKIIKVAAAVRYPRQLFEPISIFVLVRGYPVQTICCNLEGLLQKAYARDVDGVSTHI